MNDTNDGGRKLVRNVLYTTKIATEVNRFDSPIAAILSLAEDQHVVLNFKDDIAAFNYKFVIMT